MPFLRNSPTAQDFHAWLLKRRALAQRCAFGGFFYIAPNLLGQKPPKPQFWGVNRPFQAKLAKSKNVHIIKTTPSIPTKFCTVINTTKCPSRVVPTHALQIQDGGRPPSWKNRKIAISWPRFDRFWQNLACWSIWTISTVLTVKNLKFRKSKMAAAAILKNLKIAISQLQLDRFLTKFGKMMQSDPS